MSTVQLEQAINSPIHDAQQQLPAANKPFRDSFDFLCSPTAAVIESALLMLLIGWIDYVTDFNVTVFYFVPVVLATWRACRKAGWFIGALCAATVMVAGWMVPGSARMMARASVNGG